MPRIRAATIAEHKRLTRRAVIDAALEVFPETGYAGASLTDVAAVAGMGRTTLYEYFGNKAELLLALLGARVPPLLAEAVDALPAADPVTRLEHLLRAAFELTLANRDLAWVLFRVAQELPAGGRERRWDCVEPFTIEIRRLCVAGLGSGTMVGAAASSLADTVNDVLVGGIIDVLALGDRGEEVEDVIEERVRFIRQGVTGGLSGRSA